jgi:hypothetical protein
MRSLICDENGDIKSSESYLEFLYKYYSFNERNAHHRERIFTHNELYFPSPRAFNDPFDSKIQLVFDGTKDEWERYLRDLYQKFRPDWNRKQRLAEVRKRMREKRYKRLPEKMAKSYLDQMGVFCMSEVKDQILMWAHYSENHTGFCLEFKATPTTPFFGRAQKIRYSEVYPSINFFKSSRDAQMEAILLTKAKLWCYEKEWRIIEHEHGAGIYHFPPELMTGVIFGCQIPDGNKEKIIGWVKNRDPRPTVYKAEVKEREFGLDIEKLN